MVLEGGKHPLDGSDRRKQRAVVEFLCDPDKEGTEGEWEAEDKYKDSALSRRDDSNDDDDSDNDHSAIEHQLKTDDAALIWESYGPEEDVDELHLTWYTKHACEKRDDSGDDTDEGTTTHWGFFTWFVIM